MMLEDYVQIQLICGIISVAVEPIVAGMNAIYFIFLGGITAFLPQIV
jgi:hypothetical protein